MRYEFSEDCNATELEADLADLTILCWKVHSGPRSFGVQI